MCLLGYMHMNFSSFVETLPELVVFVPYFGLINFTPLVLSLMLFLGVQLVFFILKSIILVQFRRLAARTPFQFDEVLIDAISAIHPISYGVISVTIALSVFTLPDWLYDVLFVVTWVVLLWQLIRIAVVVVGYVVEKSLTTKMENEDETVVDQNAVTAAALITLLLKIALWSFGGLFILSNLGVEVTSLIAGLGIGGIAVAFALQGVLSDLFSSLSIYIDKPFRIGDFIVIGDEAGVVEKIGIKTTRIKTLQGEELVISNTELTTAHIHNYKKMSERRVAMTFGVTYETPLPLVKQIPDLVRAAFTDMPNARLGHVFFTTLGDFSLQFEVVYFIESRDFADFLTVQQQFNLGLMEQFSAHGISFAYPTQVHYNK